MTVIIRLQNLPWTANALDIRRFFQGLAIPDGGVHIVGGDKGDAFIAFSTDDDARQAMYMDGRTLSDIPIKLLLSSKTEMQNVIAVARGAIPSGGTGQSQSQSDYGRQPPPQPQPSGSSQMGMSPSMSDRGQQRPTTSGPRMGMGPSHADIRHETHGRNMHDMGGNNFQKGPFDRGTSGSDRMEGGFGRSGGSDHGEGARMSSGMGRMGNGGGGNRGRGSRGGGNQRMDRMEKDMGWNGADRPRGGMSDRTDRMGDVSGQREQMGGERPDRSGNFDRPGFNQRDGGQMGPNDRTGSSERSGGRGGRSFDSGRMGSQDRHFEGNDRMSSRGGYDEYDNQRGYDGGSDRNRESNQRDFDRRQSDFEERRQPEQDYDRRQPGRYGNEQHGDFHEERGDENWDRSVEDTRYVEEENSGFRDRDSRGHRDMDRGDNFEPEYNRQFDRENYDNDMNYRDDYGNTQEYYEEDTHGREEYVEDDMYEQDEQYNDHDGRDPRDAQMDYEGDFRGMPSEDHMQVEEFPRSGNRGGWGNKFSDRERGFGRGRGRGRGRGGFGNRGRGSGRGSFQSRDTGYDSRRRGNDLQLYVYVSNMPDTVSYKDVRRFFSGCEIPSEGLKLINDKYGNRNGTGYVMFAKEINCHHAVKRDGQMIGNNRVHINKCSGEDFNSAIDSYVPGGPGGSRAYSPPPKRKRSRSPISRAHADGSNSIVLKNVHYRATRLDIRQFLGTSKIHEEGGPHIQLGKDGRPTGTAFVRLASQADFEEALKQNKRYFLHRPVTITLITKSEFDKETNPEKSVTQDQKEKGKDESPEKGKTESRENTSTSEPTGSEKKFFCIKMRGLPFSSNVHSVREFFGGLEIANRGVHIVTTSDGKAAGPAFVEFVTSADCKKALEKDKEYIGKRYIEVAPVTKLEMMEDLKSEQQKANSRSSTTGRPPIKGIPELPGISRPGCTITMSNLPYSVQLEDIMTFLSTCRPIQDSVRLRYSKDGKPTGDAMVAFRSPNDAQRAIRELNRKVMMGRPVMVEMAP